MIVESYQFNSSYMYQFQIIFQFTILGYEWSTVTLFLDIYLLLFSYSIYLFLSLISRELTCLFFYIFLCFILLCLVWLDLQSLLTQFRWINTERRN